MALVVQHAVERTAPGRIRVRRTGSDRYICARVQGEPDAPALVALWQAAGIPAESSADIRREVWTKLMSNATLNPLSAITGATVGELARTPRTRAVLLAGMAEIFRLAERDGHPLSMTPELRVRRAEEVGGTRTSMLQDRLAGRRLETEALLAAPIAIAE
ncbi:ketopantoate reductase C-terminal domain-containing protein, partial [Azotobacter chroococcum]|nr:ketopantoate reductase C-terminal domain-containing protein [Azotobacter chroococcum]